MNKLTLARPYAKAAFSHALASNSFKTWNIFLNTIAELVKHQHAIDYLLNPITDKKEKLDFIFKLYKTLAPKEDEAKHVSEFTVKNKFIDLLAANSKLYLLAEIAALYKAYYLSHTNQLEAKVYTPCLLDQKNEQAIAKALSQRYQKTVIVQVIEDRSLIAGIIIETNNERIDASLKGKIEIMLKNIQL